MPNLSADLLIFVMGGLAIISSFLYIREYFIRKKFTSSQKEFTETTRLKTLELLKAAENAEVEVIAKTKINGEKIESEFRNYLQNLVQSSAKTISDAQSELVKFLGELKNQSQDFQEASKNTSEQRINVLFEKLETRLSDFLIQTEQKTTSSIELELKATRQLIEAYKAQQLKLIDENIIAMMEQTLNTVLGKKMSLKDQVELVYEALERAKIEKFVI